MPFIQDVKVWFDPDLGWMKLIWRHWIKKEVQIIGKRINFIIWPNILVCFSVINQVMVVNIELDIPPTLNCLPHRAPIHTLDKEVLAEAQFLAQQRKYWPSGFIWSMWHVKCVIQCAQFKIFFFMLLLRYFNDNVQYHSHSRQAHFKTVGHQVSHYRTFLYQDSITHSSNQTSANVLIILIGTTSDPSLSFKKGWRSINK